MLYLIHLNRIEIQRGLLLFMIDFIFAERVIIYGAQPRVLVTHLPTHVPMALVLPLWWTHLLLLLVLLRPILRRPLSMHGQMASSSHWHHLHLLPALRARALIVEAHTLLTTSAMSIYSFLACFIMSSLALDWM